MDQTKHEETWREVRDLSDLADKLHGARSRGDLNELLRVVRGMQSLCGHIAGAIVDEKRAVRSLPKGWE
jgi:hypothetical protein